jgi:CRISPR-associated protein (TIGR03986 family)
VEGILVIEDNDLKVRFKGKKGLKNVGIQKTELVQTFLDYQENKWVGLENTPVDFELKNGLPCKVRPRGEAWVKPQKQVSHQQDNQDRQSQAKGDFHNPYNFVPALPRHQLPKDSELADRSPVGHDRYLLEYWSGSIRVKLTTKTPLLIPDAFHASEENEHKTFPLRMLDGKPYLPSTSIKGMLRSAYEAVTNSRLSIFSEHDERLFYRMTANDGLSLIPAIVEGDNIQLLRGSNQGYPSFDAMRKKWSLPNQLMYAAWLPSYHRDSNNNLRPANLNHGDRVRVWLEQYQKTNRYGGVIFKHWKVREIVPFDRQLGDEPTPGKKSGNYSPTNAEMIETDGYLCITGHNIETKHDERVFFNSADKNSNYTYNVSSLGEDWQYLIKNYQKIHENETRDEGLEWSRQVTGGHCECQLRDPQRPTLCYAFVDASSKPQRITALYPVMISRAIYAKAPSELLSPNDDNYKLHPARKLEELSPADRVFGWVNQTGSGAYRGNFRIHSVECKTEDEIENLGGAGLPLAILGQPKPQQGRFYAAKNDRGTPFDAGAAKHEFYQAETSLRGRKVYPHHRIVADNYWDGKAQSPSSTPKPKPKPKLKSEVAPAEPIVTKNITREYLRLKSEDGIDRDNQNRSITAWVKPGVTFEFAIEITNLSSVELGALLWLLSLPESHFHRLGGGKPLGFGSVHLSIDLAHTDLRTGEDWREYYSSVLTPPTPDTFEPQKTIDRFKSAVKDAYESDFDKVSFIKAFCQAARGFDDGKPIHYPRVTPAPNPDGESFKWFVANEKNSDRQYSLDSLADDAGLPIWE